VLLTPIGIEIFVAHAARRKKLSAWPLQAFITAMGYHGGPLKYN